MAIIFTSLSVILFYYAPKEEQMVWRFVIYTFAEITAIIAILAIFFFAEEYKKGFTFFDGKQSRKAKISDSNNL